MKPEILHKSTGIVQIYICFYKFIYIQILSYIKHTSISKGYNAEHVLIQLNFHMCAYVHVRVAERRTD